MPVRFSPNFRKVQGAYRVVYINPVLEIDGPNFLSNLQFQISEKYPLRIAFLINFTKSSNLQLKTGLCRTLLSIYDGAFWKNSG